VLGGVSSQTSGAPELIGRPRARAVHVRTDQTDGDPASNPDLARELLENSPGRYPSRSGTRGGAHLGSRPSGLRSAVDVWVTVDRWQTRWSAGGSADYDGGLKEEVLRRRAPAFAVACIGPVYTPPEQRRKGYASAAVATVSQLFLHAGARVCLYTDQANPTSNGIYQAIGYQPVVDQ
jgi:GNAT superfamily N-acetyltransferase